MNASCNTSSASARSERILNASENNTPLCRVYSCRSASLSEEVTARNNARSFIASIEEVLTRLWPSDIGGLYQSRQMLASEIISTVHAGYDAARRRRGTSPT